MLTDRVNDLEQMLLKWEKSLNLPEVNIKYEEIDSIINISRDKLAEMTGREAAEAAFVIGLLALSIQRKYNQCRTFLRWCDANRNNFFGEEKSRLYQMSQAVELKTSRIEFMAKRLEFLSQCLTTIQRTRFKEDNR